jgi:DUF4097 and DUF4098 domain-containing protein YvlB
MRKSFVPLTVVFTLACFGLAGFFADRAGNEGMTSFFTNAVKDATVEGRQNPVTVTFDAAEISELQISTRSNDLKIEESPDEKMHLLFKMRANTRVPNESEILKKTGTGVYSLDLEALNSADKDVKVHFVNVFNFNVTVNDSEVVLQIPRTVKRVKPTSVSGSIKAYLDVEEIAAEAVSGDLRIQGDVSKVYAKTISGDAELELKRSAAEASLNTISGDVKVVVDSQPDFMLDFETTSGELSFDQALSETHVDGSFKKYKFGKGTGRVSIKTISGDVRISKELISE